MTRYPQLAARIFDTPLMAEKNKANTILRVLAPRLGVTTIDVAETQAETQVEGEDKNRKPYAVTEDGIAVIDISGTLVNRGSWMDAWSGLTSYEQVSNEVMDAGSDPAIKGILLRIDSYGGEASGSFDCHDMIRQAAALKPTYAAIDDAAFSAGYLLASAAERIFVTRTSGVGSIGVIAFHVDQSEYDAKVGIKVTAIYEGEHKNDYSPHQPLSRPAYDSLRAEMGRVYGMFCQAVAHARSMTLQSVMATKASLIFGDSGIKTGLATDSGTIRECIAALRQSLQTTSFFISAPSVTALEAQPLEVTTMPNEFRPLPAAPAEARTQPVARPVDQPAANTSAASALANPGTAPNPPIPAAAKSPPDPKLIVDLCAIAGRQDLLADFITSGASVEDVRKALLDARASANEKTAITSRHAGMAPTALATIELAAEKVHAAKPELTKAQAYTQALRSNPKMYDQYLAENPAQAKEFV